MKETAVKLEHINLSDIQRSKTNSTLRSEADYKGPEFDELIASIADKGVLQPVLLRAIEKGKYEIIAGERRCRAAVSIGIKTIPAQVVTMTDDEAINAQITENLQRKDIHPMAEAKAYQALLENYPNEGDDLNIESIAKRFNKLPQYVANRLQLLNLIPSLVKDFESGEMGIGHALLLCRLTKEDQKEFKEDLYGGAYPTVKELKADLEDSLSMDLSKVAFDKKDATLNPKAGACLTCAKRSGSNPLLFGDIKSKDRCFDKECFKLKHDAHLGRAVQEIIETKPEVYLVRDYREPDPVLIKLLQKHNIKPLKIFDDFRDENEKGYTKAKGLWISGTSIGKTTDIYLRPKSKAEKEEVLKGKKLDPKQEVKVQVEAIKKRAERAEELDQEKVYARILEAMGKLKSMDGTEKPIDKVLFRWMILQQAGFGRAEKLIKEHGVKDDDKKDYLESIAKLSDKAFLLIARQIMFDKHSGQATAINSAPGKIVWRMAEELKLVPVDQYVKEQDEIAAKRKERVSSRLAALKKSV